MSSFSCENSCYHNLLEHSLAHLGQGCVELLAVGLDLVKLEEDEGEFLSQCLEVPGIEMTDLGALQIGPAEGGLHGEDVVKVELTPDCYAGATLSFGLKTEATAAEGKSAGVLKCQWKLS